MRLAFLLLLMSCASIGASIREDNRRRDLRAQLDPGKGRWSMEDAARAMGVPHKRDTIGSSEYWTYDRTGTHLRGTGTNVETRQEVDVVTLEFKDGVMVSWRAEIDY